MSMAYSRMKERGEKWRRQQRRRYAEHDGPWTSIHSKAKRMRFLSRVAKRWGRKGS